MMGVLIKFWIGNYGRKTGITVSANPLRPLQLSHLWNMQYGSPPAHISSHSAHSSIRPVYKVYLIDVSQLFSHLIEVKVKSPWGSWSFTACADPYPLVVLSRTSYVLRRAVVPRGNYLPCHNYLS